jgi:hypothetical protein
MLVVMTVKKANPALKRDAAKARRPLALYMDAHYFAKPSIDNIEHR